MKEPAYRPNSKKIKYLAIAILFLLSSISWAYCPAPEPRTKTRFTRCDVALVGTVISVKPVEVIEDGERVINGYYYRVKARKLYKGSNQEYIEVYEDNDSARMGLEIKHTYLIFAYKQKGGKLQGWCNDAVDAKSASYKLRINEVKEVSDNINAGIKGDILGFVGENENCGSDGVANIPIVITDGNTTYKTVTDNKGWFSIAVPPGNYKVKSSDPKKQIRPTIYSPDNPDNVEVKIAGGAELGFVANTVNRASKWHEYLGLYADWSDSDNSGDNDVDNYPSMHFGLEVDGTLVATIWDCEMYADKKAYFCERVRSVKIKPDGTIWFDVGERKLYAAPVGRKKSRNTPLGVNRETMRYIGHITSDELKLTCKGKGCGNTMRIFNRVNP